MSRPSTRRARCTPSAGTPRSPSRSRSQRRTPTLPAHCSGHICTQFTNEIAHTPQIPAARPSRMRNCQYAPQFREGKFQGPRPIRECKSRPPAPHPRMQIPAARAPWEAEAEAAAVVAIAAVVAELALRRTHDTATRAVGGHRDAERARPARRIQTHADTHTQAHTRRYTHADTDTRRHTHADTHTQTHTHTRTRTGGPTRPRHSRRERRREHDRRHVARGDPERDFHSRRGRGLAHAARAADRNAHESDRAEGLRSARHPDMHKTPYGNAYRHARTCSFDCSDSPRPVPSVVEVRSSSAAIATALCAMGGVVTPRKESTNEPAHPTHWQCSTCFSAACTPVTWRTAVCICRMAVHTGNVYAHALRACPVVSGSSPAMHCRRLRA